MTNFNTFRINEAHEENSKIDHKDEKIMQMLSANARIPVSAISKKIRLSKEGTFYRIRRLEHEKILLRYYPMLDLRGLGYSTYHLFMVIDEINPERKEELLKYLLEHPNTKGVMEYSDRWDLEWELIAKDVLDFDNIVTGMTKQFSDIILEKNKFEIILGYKSIQYPEEEEREGLMLRTRIKRDKKIDDKDIEIIAELSENAKQSTYKIGEKVKLSPDAVQYRIKKLQDNGIIRQFSIMPNFSSLGYHWQTMAIGVKTFHMNQEFKFKEYISTKPEVIRAVKVLGNWDLMMHIVTKKTEDLHRIVKDIQKTFVDIIISYQTWGGYKEHYFTTLPKIIIDEKKKK